VSGKENAMVFKNSRTTLDSELTDPRLTLLLVTGSHSSVIHEFRLDRLTAWRRCGMIADAAILTSAAYLPAPQ
jgi:hypothetical protein